MAAVNGRELVLDMLLMVEREEAYSHKLIQDVLNKYDYLEGRDKAFIKRLFEGTLERRIEMDYYINATSKVSVSKMKPLIRNLLRMSVYQIFYMDQVPDRATINEAVTLAVKRKFVNLKGFVNGVLRNIAAKKEEYSLPDREHRTKEYLSVKCSVPEWMATHFLSVYGLEKAEEILESLLKVRPVTIRFRLSMTEAEREEWIARVMAQGICVRRHPHVEMAYYLENLDNIAELPGFYEGDFTIQDASSMLAVQEAGIKQGDFVMDLCAAPGGKSMLAAEYAGENGKVLSRDISAAKVSLIEENCDRMGLPQITCEVGDATILDEEKCGIADVVIADVPCSGLGVMGRKRDIKYRQKAEALDTLPDLQKQIVNTAVTYVKQGGTLLYSTCTINPKENEKMAEYIEKELGMKVEKCRQLLPCDHDTDGFFYAICKKQ